MALDRVTNFMPISGREVTVNPHFGRRMWVKLWVNEWLEGTTRGEMSDAQRAFWIDLLAMAGRSRYPGVVCAGKGPDGKFIGYSINKYQGLMSEPIDVEETLALFVRTGKVCIEVTSTAPRLLAVELLNWEKYQSEYQRQKPYRQKAKLQRSDTGSYTEGHTTEGEVEVEGEVERKPSATKPVAAFATFWTVYPRKVHKPEAKKAWAKIIGADGNVQVIVAAVENWKRSEQWQDQQFIPHPAKFLNQRQWEDEVPVGRRESNRRPSGAVAAKPGKYANLKPAVVVGTKA